MERDLGKAISGVDFPARKEDLLRRAKKNKASSQVLEKLESLPNIRYNSLERIWAALDMPSRRVREISVSPKQNEFFYETLDSALRELHFPATKEQLVEESKGVRFTWGEKDVVFALQDVVEDLEEEEYRKPEEVMDEINAFIKKSSE